MDGLMNEWMVGPSVRPSGSGWWLAEWTFIEPKGEMWTF